MTSHAAAGLLGSGEDEPEHFRRGAGESAPARSAARQAARRSRVRVDHGGTGAGAGARGQERCAAVWRAAGRSSRPEPGQSVAGRSVSQTAFLRCRRIPLLAGRRQTICPVRPSSTCRHHRRRRNAGIGAGMIPRLRLLPDRGTLQVVVRFNMLAPPNAYACISEERVRCWRTGTPAGLIPRTSLASRGLRFIGDIRRHQAYAVR